MASADPNRSFIKDVKRIIIKVGTAVITRNDGRLALGRIGSLCEQVKDLNAQGYEVIMVTSGAVGVGRQRLRYRKLVNSSFADLQKPQMELDGKACAAVGQSGLMALYDMLFTQLDVSSSQLLVTDSDFDNSNFRERLRETVESLLELRVIPIFNENDAISTRKAPYEDSSGIFWDNDSLAGLLALELKADLLVLLSDVDGLYSGPPSEPSSKLIHTYIKEKHYHEITFGDKSRVGRGGMTAKVQAAVWASTGGVPVVITSGCASQSLVKVLRGEKIGTLFHKNASSWEPSKDASVREMAVAARDCSRRLQNLSSEERKKILLDVADALEANEDLIRSENEADVAAAHEAGYETTNTRKSILLVLIYLSEHMQYFMQFMIKGGFMCTHTPKITGVSEGGSAVFKVNYFKEHTASLAQSPQLYKQMLINGGINRVFEIGPVFRAEDSNTHRHLCEYIGLHAEMQIKEHYFEVIDFVDSLFVDIFDHLAKNCSEMLDMIQEQYPCERLKYLQQNVRLKYSEGIEMLQESGFPIQEPQDLNNKAELMLGKLVLQKYKTDFFILYEYPLALRPFYTMPSAEKRQPGSYSNSFDAFIRGQEVLSGSQRIHDKSLLIKMIDERGYNKTTFQQFSNTFGCGAPPRGGFGVGLERLVMLYLGVPDFRIASLFPRDPGRLAP